jgi:RecB family exonuclease
VTHSVHASASSVHLPVVPSAKIYSHARLHRFAQCPLSYKLDCVDSLLPEPSAEFELGVMLHRALAGVVRHHMDAGRTGPLDAARAVAEYQLAWSESQLSDPAAFAEGLDLVKGWVAREGVVNAEDVLAVQEVFDFEVGGVRLLGAMDRADRIADDAVRVRDYTSARIPASRRDVEENLKLAIYDLAAAQLWPWAKRVEVGLDLLRHDRVIALERSDAQRDATRRYVQAMVARIEGSRDFPACLSTECTHCDQRRHCSAYMAARTPGPRERDVGEREAAERNLAAVAREREELAARIKILGVRKDELDGVLTQQLAVQDELVLEGRRYRLVTATRKEYPFVPTLSVLIDAGVDAVDVVDRLAYVDGTALKRELDEQSKRLDPAALRELRAVLDGAAKCSLSTRLTSTPVGHS